MLYRIHRVVAVAAAVAVSSKIDSRCPRPVTVESIRRDVAVAATVDVAAKNDSGALVTI